MKPSTHRAIGQARGTSTGTGDVQTLTPPGNASAMQFCVETTNARMTLDGSTPSATNGNVELAAQSPQFLPVGAGSQIKWISTAAAASIVNVTWFE